MKRAATLLFIAVIIGAIFFAPGRAAQTGLAQKFRKHPKAVPGRPSFGRGLRSLLAEVERLGLDYCGAKRRHDRRRVPLIHGLIRLLPLEDLQLRRRGQLRLLALEALDARQGCYAPKEKLRAEHRQSPGE